MKNTKDLAELGKRMKENIRRLETNLCSTVEGQRYYVSLFVLLHAVRCYCDEYGNWGAGLVPSANCHQPHET